MFLKNPMIYLEPFLYCNSKESWIDIEINAFHSLVPDKRVRQNYLIFPTHLNIAIKYHAANFAIFANDFIQVINVVQKSINLYLKMMFMVARIQQNFVLRNYYRITSYQIAYRNSNLYFLLHYYLLHSHSLSFLLNYYFPC